MKWLIPILVLLLVFLQYRLWFGEGGLEEISRLEQRVQEQGEVNPTGDGGLDTPFTAKVPQIN